MKVDINKLMKYPSRAFEDLGVIDVCDDKDDRYYAAYEPIILPCSSFMFIEMKFIYCHSCVMVTIKTMSIRND